MALEIAAFRIVGRVFGTALRETTTVIAVFMTAMSIGYWAGGRVGDRWPNRTTLAVVFGVAAISIAVIPWLDRGLSLRIASSPASLSFHAFLASVSLFFVPTVFLAAVSPIAIRLRTVETAQSGTTAGSISALSTVGSIFGTILTAFVLFDWLQSIDRTVLVLATTVVFTTAVVIAGDSPSPHPAGRRRIGLIFRIVGLAGLCTAAIAYSGSTFFAASTQRAGNVRNVLFETDSRYHHIIVKQHGGGKFRVLQFDAATVQSSMIVADPTGPGADYTNYAHLAKLARPDAKSMLVIGLGGGTVVKQFLRFYPEMTIDAVELDPVVADVARELFFVTPSPRLRVHVSDGRVFLNTASSAAGWDMISIDSYTTNRYGATIPPHLVTVEFFSEAKRHLNPGGVLHFHCFTGLHAPMSRAVGRTLGEVFPTVVTFSGEGFTEFFASAAAIARSDVVGREDMLPWIDLSAAAARGLNTSATWSVSDPVLTDDYAPIDTLLRRKS